MGVDREIEEGIFKLIDNINPVIILRYQMATKRAQLRCPAKLLTVVVVCRK